MMRCPYCGSKMIYPDVHHKQFSTGKAVAGAVAFGAVGVTAGFIGKDNKGYRCSACGAFSTQTMDLSTEIGINNAIHSAEKGDFSVYNELRKQYPNIETVAQNNVDIVHSNDITNNILENSVGISDSVVEEKPFVKNSYSPRIFVKDCPIYVETIFIKTIKNNDVVSFLAWNISEKTLRSVYFKIKVLDDVGDEISTCSCAYQRLAIKSGENLPLDKEFNLNTDLAYKVQLEIEKAAFDDDTVWRKSEDSIEFELSEQAEILPENFPKYKYLRAIVESESELSDSDSLFQPIFEEEFTQCICGLPMNKHHPCARCGMSEESLTAAISYEKLLEYQIKSIKDLALKRSKSSEKLLNIAREEKYKKAIALQDEDSKEAIHESIRIFKQLGDYKDSLEQIEAGKNKEKILDEKIAAKRMADEKAAEEKRIAQEKEAERRRLEQERIAEEKRLEEERLAEIARKEAEKRAKRNKKIAIITTPIVCACIAFIIVLNTVIIPNGKYKDAIDLMGSEKYEDAVALFDEISDYKDAGEKRKEALYLYAVSYQDAEEYENAITTFEQIKGYKDCNDRIGVCQTAILDNKYSAALALMKDGKYENAISAFEEIKTHKDSAAQISTCMSTLAKNYASKGDTTNAIKWYEKMGDKESANKVRYDYVLANKNNTNTTTYEYLKTLKSAGYKDSASVYESLYSWNVNLCMNADKNNHTSKASTIPQSTGDPYVHYSVSGGYPGQVFKLKLVHETRLKPGLGNNPLEDWEVEDRGFATGDVELTAADGCKCIILYPRGSNLLYHRITIYNGETGKQLASVTVYTPYDR